MDDAYIVFFTAEFAFVSLQKFLQRFSKQLYRKQSLMSALSSEPIMVEISASLA